jgi:hypothetical protein
MLPAPTPSPPTTNFSINANDTVNANYNECIFKHIFTTKILANIQPVSNANPANPVNPATDLAQKIIDNRKLQLKNDSTKLSELYRGHQRHHHHYQLHLG